MSSIEFSRWISIATKAVSRTTAPARQATITGLPQPSALPRIRPKMSRKSAAEKVTRPPQSIGCGSVALMLTSFVSVMTRAPIPIGTLTKKIHSQPRLSVRIPPISGPTATAPPTVAPQIPIAVARSRPSNSWAIRASEVANIAAAPAPCRPRPKFSIVGSLESPQSAEATMNRPKPMLKTRRRPSRSPIEPKTSRKEARVRA